MGFIDIFKRQKPIEKPQEERQISLNGLGFNSLNSFSNTRAMKLSAVYCAVNQISNAVSILPINIVEVKERKKRVVKHSLYSVLNLYPCERFTHFEMMKMMIESVFLKGNAYALINRDERLKVKSLEYIDADYVTPMIDKDGRVKYLVAGMHNLVDSVNMIHLYQHIDETYNGISTLKYASQVLKGVWAMEENASNFFTAGSQLNGVIESTTPLNQEQKAQIRDSWGNFATEGVHIAVLPQGLSYKPISVNPDDAALLDSREFGIVEVARFFLIPPSKLFVMDNVSYNSMEFSQLTYLSDTILPIVTMIENEFNRKLFLPSEMGKLQIDFDFEAILETDLKSKAQYYSQMLTNGVLCIDEVRDKLGFEPIGGEAGKCHWVQLSYGNAEDIAQGNYIKQTEQNPSSNTKLDNKLNNKEDENKDKNTDE